MKKSILIIIFFSSICISGFSQSLRGTSSKFPCGPRGPQTNNEANNRKRQYRASITPKEGNETVKAMPTNTATQAQAKPQESGKPLKPE